MWLVYAISASIIWGLNYALNDRILRKISPTTMLGLQMLVGATVFLGAGAFSRLREDLATLSRDRNTMMWVAAAVVAANLANLLISMSIRAKNATLAGLIELSYPVYTVLFTWLLFKEAEISVGVLAGGALVFAGVLVITHF